MAGAARKKTPPADGGSRIPPGGSGSPPRTAKPSAKVRSVLAKVERAVRDAESAHQPVKLIILLYPSRKAAQVDVEPLAPADELGAALTEARTRGAARAAEILTGPDMLGADAFARTLGMTREAVRQKLMRRDVLGLTGAKRGVRYPAWQVTPDGGLLPRLREVFEAVGDQPWTVYRFLTQPNPATGGRAPRDLLRAGEAGRVLAAAEAFGRGDFG